MGKCPNCNAPYESGLILCDQCGELLPESSNVALVREEDPAALAGDVSSVQDDTADAIDATTELAANETNGSEIEATDEFDEEILESTGDFSDEVSTDLEATADIEDQSHRELTETAELDPSAQSSDGDEEGTLDFIENPLLAETRDFAPVVPSGNQTGDDTETIDEPTTASDGNHTDGEDTVDLDEHVVEDELTIDEALAIEANGDVGSVNTDKEGTYVYEDATVDLAQTHPLPQQLEKDDELGTLDATGEKVGENSDAADTISPPGTNLVQSETGTVYYAEAAENPDSAEGGDSADKESPNVGDTGDFDDTADFELSDDQAEGQDVTAILDPSRLPSDSDAANFTRQESGETRIASSQENQSSLGTTGHLQRMWQGVAKSIDNPMQSLQAVGLEASQEIFEKVALRHVSEPNEARTADTDYHIVSKLGEGAMGVVYEALQTGVERRVALKTAKANYSKNESSRRRFLYEAQITAELSHSNIVPIYELGSSAGGMLFYSMKVVEGTPWKSTIGKQTRDENLEIFMKVADAMAFAHSRGVIHRDLKPENTMLGSFGEVFVTDWGTALDLSKESAQISRFVKAGGRTVYVNQTGHFRPQDSVFFIRPDGTVLDKLVIHRVDHRNQRLEFKKRLNVDYEEGCVIRKVMTMAGTPCYMSPEMAGHDLAKIGPASDIYLLGAILYQIAAGSPPHKAKSVPDCLKVALANDLVKTETNDSLTLIAFRAMATDPADRFPSVEAMQEAIREYRRHAESIAVAKRSRRLLADAIREKDYDSFSRAIFGYRDALELWPENTNAEQGMRTARLALGKAALEKGDYDLVLQTVSEDEADEAEIYRKARVAKKKAAAREANFRTLQRVVAIVIIGALIGLSTLASIAFNQARIANNLAENNEKLAARESEAKDKALAAQEVAETQREIAEEKRNEAEEQKNKALEAQRKEEIAKKEAQDAADREKLAKQKEAKAKQDALVAKDKAEKLADEKAKLAQQEIKLKLEAQQQAAQIQLAQFQSTLALAKSQIESLDLAAGIESLERIDALDLDVFQGQKPNFKTWPYLRTKLLSNRDLPTVDFSNVSAIAAANRRIAIGTRDGSLTVLKPARSQLEQLRQFQLPNNDNVSAVTLSPSGEQLAFSLIGQDGTGSVYLWDLSNLVSRPMRLTQSGNRSFQTMAFSADGTKLVAGLSNGFWMWDSSDPTAAPNRMPNLRGSLVSLQPVIGHSQIQFVFTAIVAGAEGSSLVAGSISSDDESGVQTHDLPQGVRTLTCVAPLPVQADDVLQLALGTEDRRLFVADLRNSSLVNASELSGSTERHRGPITILSASADRIISGSTVEPTCHVWRRESDSQSDWIYDTYLQGSAQNLALLAQISVDEVVSVDSASSCRYFNIASQKRRQRLERRVESSSGAQASERYLQPVQSLLIHRNGQKVVAFDRNGAFDIWGLNDGLTRRISDAGRWSFIGHTPGAELVDIQFSNVSKRILTASRLNNATTDYLARPSSEGTDWEFCLWNQQTGNLERRWTRENPHVPGESYREAVEPRVSLINDGQQLIYASDSVTEILDLKSGSVVWRKEDFGTYFAVPNPRFSNLVMLVKRSGALRILDLTESRRWDDDQYRNFTLADPSDIPVRGAWSPDGQRFYMTCTTGMLAAFEWAESGLKLVWSSRALNDTQDPADQQLRNALTGIRPQSHLDVDLQVDTSENGDTVSVATRNRGTSPDTRHVQLLFDRSDANLSRARPELNLSLRVAGPQWLRRNATGTCELTSEVHHLLAIDGNQIRGHVQANGHTFISTRNARVVELEDRSSFVTSFGRTQFLNATADENLNRCLALFEGGVLWKVDLQAASSSASVAEQIWQRASFTVTDALEIQLSPDGSSLLVQRPDGFEVLDANTGASIYQMPHAAVAAWQPDRPASLSCIHGVGSEVQIDADGHATLGEIEFQGIPAENTSPFRWNSANRNLKDIHFLTEQFQDQAPKAYLAIQTIGDVETTLELVASAAADIPRDSRTLLSVPKGSQILVSPSESVIATGTPNGTVTIWYASPTWSEKALALFDLEGHRGAALTSMKFSLDGKTLVTADGNNRLYGWLSEAP